MKNLSLLNSKLEQSQVINSSVNNTPNDFQNKDLQKKVEIPK